MTGLSPWGMPLIALAMVSVASPALAQPGEWNRQGDPPSEIVVGSSIDGNVYASFGCEDGLPFAFLTIQSYDGAPPQDLRRIAPFEGEDGQSVRVALRVDGELIVTLPAEATFFNDMDMGYSFAIQGASPLDLYNLAWEIEEGSRELTATFPDNGGARYSIPLVRGSDISDIYDSCQVRVTGTGMITPPEGY